MVRLLHKILNIRTTRIGLLVFLDIVFVAISYILAFWLRIDLLERSYAHSVYDTPYILATLPWLICIRVLCGWAFKLYHWSFSHASMSEGADLVISVVAGSAVFALMGHVAGAFPAPPPRSIYVLEAAMSFAGMAFLRFFPGYLLVVWAQRVQQQAAANMDARRTLIYGTSNNAEAVAKDLMRTHGHGYSLVGFIDDNPAHWNSHIQGVRVWGGLRQLPGIIDKNRVDQILVTEGELSGKAMRTLVDICGPRHVRLKSIPPYRSILKAAPIANTLKDINPESLLDRRPVDFSSVRVDELLLGKTILVTGAGGTIGAELCRQVSAHGAKKVIIYDINENALYFLDAELREEHPDVEVELVIGSIRDRDRLDETMRAHRPHVVFHAAAHKHVPLLESAPGEAIKNNVLGTCEVAEAAMANNVERFVLISTDKAVSSANILGASKRLAEMLVRNMNGKSRTKFFSVRFGNVLDSNGSLVDVLRRQIAKGGPVTVTHPEMSRYFMTIQEAAGLVVVAAALGEGEIAVLDMGEPIRIDTLVRQVIFLYGLTPEKDIEIVYTGPRPGEKMHEELYGDRESIAPSSFPRINIVTDDKPVALAAMLADARLTVQKNDEEEAREFFRRWVKDFTNTGN